MHGALPVETLRTMSAFATGRDLTPSRDTLAATVPPPALARLRLLHAEAAALTRIAPSIVASTESARGLEQALAEALLGCFGAPKRSEVSPGRHRHLAILRKLRNVVEEHEGESLWVLQRCAEVGISSRRLHEICNEYLGMGPKRYLLLRRMDLVHRALRQADPGETTVTEVATRYGFWELGRFAVTYRTLYGEPPSWMLRGPAGFSSLQPNDRARVRSHRTMTF
jgi:AraC-like DNA-binding protein